MAGAWERGRIKEKEAEGEGGPEKGTTREAQKRRKRERCRG